MVFTEAKLKRSPLYAEQLGIKLSSNSDRELFKWFLASQLYGGRIAETIAEHTYRAFKTHQLLTPAKVLNAGRDYLVNPVMRDGGYVRYDESKSRQLLRNCQQLLDEYQGSLRGLHDTALTKADLEQRLLAFYGVGPVTLNIFLRELRPYWKKADPEPLPVVERLAQGLGIRLSGMRRKTLTYCRVEAGLIRHRKQIARQLQPV